MVGAPGDGEFDFIGRHFRPLAGPGALDLRNDGGLMSCAADEEFVVSTDTMVADVHFFSTDPPATIGRKLLRCNLSDLAAMGATPHAYTLNITVPQNGRYDDAWFAAFAEGLSQDQHRFDVFLLGGDTTGTSGPLVLGATVYGRVSRGQSLHRNTARPGDGVWVTGTIGDAALGLKVLEGALTDPDGTLVQRYHLPEPRTGLALHGVVHAAMDVSDGLVQDCGHIARESHVALVIASDCVPLSAAARALGPVVEQLCLTGGDDYELLLTCAPENEARLRDLCREQGIRITRIGSVEAGSGVKVRNPDGKDITPKRGGWQHFQPASSRQPLISKKGEPRA